MKRLFVRLSKTALTMVCMIVAFAVVILIAAMIFDSPTANIQRRTGFWCHRVPVHEYNFDDVGHGREFDTIDIYELKGHDAKRFTDFANSNVAWNPLPLDASSNFDGLAILSFDSHMEDMLTCPNGYWHSSDDHPRILCVFDSENNKLFIRMRTW